MKKRKIPRWLSRAAALVGILAVLVSLLLVPVSAAVTKPVNGASIYGVRNAITNVAFRQPIFEDQRNNYTSDGYVILWAPTQTINRSPTASLHSTWYDGIAWKAGDDIRYCTTVSTISEIANNYNHSEVFTTELIAHHSLLWSQDGNNPKTPPTVTSIQVTLENVFMTPDDYGGFIDSNSGFYYDAQSFFGFDEKGDYTVIYEYSMLEFVDDGYTIKRQDNIEKTISSDEYVKVWCVPDELNVTKTTPIGERYAYYPYVHITITRTDGGRFSASGFSMNQTYDYQYNIAERQRQAEFYDAIGLIYYVDNTVDADFSSWIVTAVGGFMDFELFPGLSIASLLAVIGGIGLVIMFLKYFSGG